MEGKEGGEGICKRPLMQGHGHGHGDGRWAVWAIHILEIYFPIS